MKSLTHKHPYLAIQGLFIAVAMTFSLAFVLIGHLRTGDLTFNYLRLKDVSVSLSHFKWPQFSFYTGTILGNATNTMYPWLIFTPLLPFMNVLPPILWWSVMIATGVLTGLEATYFSFRSLGKPKRYALWVAIIYCLSTMMIDATYGQSDIGTLYATMASPLVFAGWLSWLRHDRWKMMTVGLLLMTCSNLPSGAGMILLIILSTAVFWKDLTVGKILTAIKAGAVYAVSSAVVWLPMIVLDANNRIVLPTHSVHSVLEQESQPPLILENPLVLLIPGHLLSWTYLDLLGLFLAVKYWKQLSVVSKRFVMISGVILFANVKPVDLFLMHYTFFSYFQFMRRFSFYSHLLLTVVLVNIIFKIIVKQWSNKARRRLFKWIVGILAVGMFLGESEEYLDQLMDKPFSTFNYSRDKESIQNRMYYSNRDLENQRTFHDLPAIYTDYYPDTVRYYVNRNGTNKLVMPNVTPNNYRGNQFVFHAKRAGERTIPVVIYHHQAYHVKANSKSVPFRVSKGYLRVPAKRGRNAIAVSTPVMPYRYLAMLMSVAGVVILIFKRKRSHRNV